MKHRQFTARIVPWASGIFARLRDEAAAVPRLYLFRRPALVALVVFAALLVAAERRGWLERLGPRDPAVYAESALAAVGVVVDAPDARPSGCVYVVELETVTPPGERARSADGRLLVHVLGSTRPVCGPGERVRAFGRIRRPEAARTPGAFDYRRYLAVRGIHAVMYAGAPSFEPLGPSGRRRAAALGWRLNRRFLAAFERHLPPERAVVLAGLSIGQRPRFHPEVKRAFVESGTMHVLVASGSNVGFLLAGWLLVAAAAGMSRRAALLSGLPALWAYVLVVGGDAPISRAGAMATVGILAHALGREDRPVHALALAALLQLALDPRRLFDVGFQMSFVTVLGLLHHLPAVEGFASARGAWIRWPVRAVSVGLVAQLWLLPVSAGVFHRLYPWSLAANLAVVPMAGAGLGLGGALAAADFLGSWLGVPRLAAWVAAPASMHAGLMLATARFFAGLGAPWWLPSPTPLGVAAFYGLCLSLVHARRSALAKLVVAGCAVALAAGGLRPPPCHPRRWGAAWLDMGTRSSVVLIDRDRRAVLINPGPVAPADSAERTLAPFLAANGVRRLEAVVATDARVSDAEIAAVSEQVPVGGVIDWREGGEGTRAAGGYRLSALAAPAWVGERPVLVERDGASLLLAHRLELETQGALIERRAKPSAAQARFAPDAVWSPDFVRRLKPEVVIDTAGPKKEALSPWPNAAMRRPHGEGWIWWDASAAAEQVDAEKTRGEAARVRPPGHAADVAVNRARRQGAQAAHRLREKP